MPDTIDINIYPVVETVTLNIQPNLTTINVNTVAGGGTQTLQQTMALGRTYVQTIGTLTYTFTLIDDTVELSVFDSSTNITNKLLLQDGAELSYLDPDNGKSSVILLWGSAPLIDATNSFGTNRLTIPYRTSGSGGAIFRLQNNLPAATYDLATLDDLENTNTNAIDRITVKLSQSINKGQAVYISSATGTNIIVSKASNSSEPTSSKTLGLLETTGVTNDFVNVVTSGLLTGLNTSTATIGDAVWLGVNGNLIYGLANKPYAPAHLVYIGVVSRVSATVGEIIVKVQNGFELKEIHDVDLISNAPTNNQGLIYESATSLWKNKTIIEDSIVNSVIDKAPSQNAVFDALALKQTDLQEFQTKQGIYLFDDFLGNVGGSVFNSYSFSVLASGTGASCQPSTTYPNRTNQQGVMQIATGTTLAGSANIRVGDNNAGSHYLGNGVYTMQYFVNVETLSTLTERFYAIFGATTNSNFTNTSGIFFIYDEGVGTYGVASPNWKCITKNGILVTSTITSVAVTASQWYVLKIVVNATATSVEFYIDNVLVATHTTNIVTLITPRLLMQKTIGTTSRNAYVDYFLLKQIYTTPRTI